LWTYFILAKSKNSWVGDFILNNDGERCSKLLYSRELVVPGQTLRWINFIAIKDEVSTFLKNIAA
jgi:hypothetical protein